MLNISADNGSRAAQRASYATDLYALRTLVINLYDMVMGNYVY